MKNKWSLILFISLIFPFQEVISQDWLVPPDKSAVINPSAYNLENIKQGKEIYTRNCQSCHGDPGKNNPLALVPVPVDIASERMHENSEGDLFYKISAGRGIMPPFESTLSEDERWKLVNFIMNYKPGGNMLLVDAPPVQAKLMASVNEEKSTVEVFAEDENGMVLPDAPIIISAKKTFGNIELGRAFTNDNGRTEFIIPEDVIGDEEGYVIVVVSIGDGFDALEVALDRARIGKKKEVPKLIDGKVLWSTNENVQIWLLLSYLLAAGGAWAVIVYVVYQIIKIKRLSRSS